MIVPNSRDNLLDDSEPEKNVLNYFEKLFTNEDKSMNASYSAVSGRGS